MKIYKIPFNFALFISTLILLIIGTYSISALNQFYEYKKVSNSNVDLTLDRFHFFLKNELMKEWIKLTSLKPINDENSHLKTFRFSIKQKNLDTLNIDLPISGKDHYIDAFMHISDKKDKIYKVQLRYRGDQINHWLFDQKSLRIKLAKNDLYNMEKKFNLINPPMITTVLDVVNYELAKKLKLITPDFYPSRVFINGKYMGVYFYLSQIDESLLRKYRRMPGSIYKGDYGLYNVKDKNGVSTLFKNSDAWKKIASRNAEQKKNRDDIEFYIKNINSINNLNFYNFFNTYTDKNKYYNFFALDVILGSEHHDYAHNHFVYFDPYKGKFEPIEWDIRYWRAKQKKDLSVYYLLDKVKLNPILEYERDQVAYNLLISKDFQPKNIFNKLLYESNLSIMDLLSDKYRDEAGENNYKDLVDNLWYAVPYTMDKYHQKINNKEHILFKRQKNLLKIYNNAEFSYKITKLENQTIIEFFIFGNSPIQITYNKEYLYRDLNNNNKIDDKDVLIEGNEILYPGRKWKKKNYIDWTFGRNYKELVPAMLTYKYIVNYHNVKIEDFNIVNAITGKKVKRTNKKYYEKADSIHPWDIPHEIYSTKIFEGIIDINNTIEFDKYTTVTIKPGTVFLMDQNVSIYFYGKVLAIGNKEEPIKFIAKNPKEPWGLVAIQGKSTTGSKFEYVEFENGSIDTHNLIHYTSPFNIHDTNWFEVRHCKIGHNFIGDDSMHIAYSKGIVDHCEFKNARSDGLDIDISDVNVSNNVFYNSGNDGLDIMTTNINASNNIFINTGDKGISVGEWSDANITDSFFLKTAIGMEIKDKSKVFANNLIFIDSKEKAINLYNKNKRYDFGGFLQAKNIYLIGNTIIKADKKSFFNIDKCNENLLPDLENYIWYRNIKNSTYINLISDIKVKNVQ